MQIRVEKTDEISTTVFRQQKNPRSPGSPVLDAGVQVLGDGIDNGRPAFASKSLDGWTSIYVGAAPLTVDVLRRIARDAG